MEAAGGGAHDGTDRQPHFLYLPGSLPQSARRPVPPHRLVATLPQPSCTHFISIVCDRPNAASGLRRVQALGELARAWFVHILRASSIARFRATEPARSSKSKSPGGEQRGSHPASESSTQTTPHLAIGVQVNVPILDVKDAPARYFVRGIGPESGTTDAMTHRDTHTSLVINEKRECLHTHSHTHTHGEYTRQLAADAHSQGAAQAIPKA